MQTCHIDNLGPMEATSKNYKQNRLKKGITHVIKEGFQEGRIHTSTCAETMKLWMGTHIHSKRMITRLV